MNVYIKNVVYLLVALAGILVALFVPAIPSLYKGYIIFVALIVIARATGKLINHFFISLYLKKRKNAETGEAREKNVRDKSVTVTLIIVFVFLVVATMRPQLFGNQSSLVLLSMAVFVWHIINIPVFIYYDKNLALTIKKLK